MEGYEKWKCFTQYNGQQISHFGLIDPQAGNPSAPIHDPCVEHILFVDLLKEALLRFFNRNRRPNRSEKACVMQRQPAYPACQGNHVPFEKNAVED
jgi:hypothetical protein